MGFVGESHDLQSASAVLTSETTIPAEVADADTDNPIRVYALVGSGATTALPVTPPAGAGWTLLRSYQPTSNYTELLYYRDITDGGEAGDTVTWTWANTSRTWIALLAYDEVDTGRAPQFDVLPYTTYRAGPFAAPSLSVPPGDWLMTLASGRESPGTDTAKSWTTNITTDVERVDMTSTNSGSGQKYVVGAWDTNGSTIAAPGGGGDGAVDGDFGAFSTSGGVGVGPQARPTNTFNRIASNARPFRVGCTIKKDELGYWRAKLVHLDWMRIFPNPTTKLPPDWKDPRFTFIRDMGGSPFVSSKIDGDGAKISTLISYLNKMPTAAPWLFNNPDRVLWYAEHHEPEGHRDGLTASKFIANHIKVWNALNDSSKLNPAVRAKIMFGPALTKQYTENGGHSYRTWDPGPDHSDFFGVDMYMNSWSPSNSKAVATAYTNPVTFLSQFKAYTYDGEDGGSTTDHRPRVFPELGAIGLPSDTDGSARAAWLQGIHNELLTWDEDEQGWPFAGWVFWNAEGTGGRDLSGAGVHRWFQFDRRHNGQPYDGDRRGGYDLLASVNPPSGDPDPPPPDPGGGGGPVASDRALSTNIAVNQAHVWSVTIPMVVETPVDPTTINAWSYAGLPQS